MVHNEPSSGGIVIHENAPKYAAAVTVHVDNLEALRKIVRALGTDEVTVQHLEYETATIWYVQIGRIDFTCHVPTPA